MTLAFGVAISRDRARTHGAAARRFQQLFAPRLECSDEGVVTLVRRILREDLGKGELSVLINPEATTLSVEAIRTRSTEGNGVRCAAHVTWGFAFRQGLVETNPEVAATFQKASSSDIEYQAEPTDDRQQIYVTVKQATD